MKRVWQFFVTNQTGDTQSNAQITVTENGSAATIYADKTGTPKSNPFLADSNGLARFYGDAGKYYTISIQVGTETLTLPDVYLGFPEPDSDNKTYGIRNGEWVEIITELSVTKESLGLGNVDNTSDINKPISTAQQQALNLKQGIISGAATTITNDNLAASKVLASSSLGKVAVGDCDADKLAYLKTARSDLQAQIDAIALSQDSYYLGTYIAASIAAAKALLEAAHPTADAGSWAILDAIGVDAVRAAWDDTDDEWVVGGSIANSDDITEGTTNLFYTAARQQAITDALALKVDKVTGKSLSTNDYDNTEKSKVQSAYDGIKPHYTTNQNVTVANETEWLAELSKAVKATYASSNILYTITLPSSINFQITLYWVDCPNLNIVIPNGATFDCTSFTNNYFGTSKCAVLLFGCTGIKISGSASTSNGTGVGSIVSAFSDGIFYANVLTNQNLELSGFEYAPLIYNHKNGGGTPKITGYSGQASLLNMDELSNIILDGGFSATGHGTVTLTGIKNVDVLSSGSITLLGDGYTGVARIAGSGTLDKQSTVPNFSIQAGSNFHQVKINSNNWNELSYTDIQALTPTNGLEFYDTTWNVKVRGNGTEWVAQNPFRVYSEKNEDSSSSTSETVLRAISVPFKYIGSKGRLMIYQHTAFSGTTSNANAYRIYVNNSATQTGGTKISDRTSANGLSLTNTRVINSDSTTSHMSTPVAASGTDVSGASVYYTYNSANMTHLVFTAQCSGLTSDTITLRSVYVDIFPMV